jgi:hypothetical protein
MASADQAQVAGIHFVAYRLELERRASLSHIGRWTIERIALSELKIDAGITTMPGLPASSGDLQYKTCGN